MLLARLLKLDTLPPFFYYELLVLHNRVESGSDDPDYLGHSLVGQVGIICKLNYLDVGCDQDFYRSHVL